MKERKGNKPVGVMEFEVYRDRIRLFWYPNRAKNEKLETAELAEVLTLLAPELGLEIGPRPQWGQRKSHDVDGRPYTDFYLR